MKNILSAFFLFLVCGISAQDFEYTFNENEIFNEDIKTVRFHVNGLPVSLPIVDLGRQARLLLTFDDMEGDDKSYTYKIRHFNADWTPSDLSENDFSDGFTEGEIRDYDFSFNTKAIFTHYALMLPNEDFRPAVSGNYTVTVFNTDTEEPVLTRRFVVVEPLVAVNIQTVRPSRTDKIDTHQEFDFTVQHEQLDVKRPLAELSATVLQNGRWDNAIQGIKPRFSNNGLAEFDYQNKIIFPAGVEFRYADFRSLDFLQLGVFAVEEAEDGYDVILNKDNKRYDSGFSSYTDINGDFIIENLDANLGNNVGLIQTLTANNAVNNEPEPDAEQELISRRLRTDFSNTAEDYLAEDGGTMSLVSDYANVTFSLLSPTEYYDEDVYVFGKMSDWKTKPEFKLTYNDEYKAYIGNVLLKQGFHNYYYVRAPKSGGGTPDWPVTEGNWYETENEYTVIVYYRSFTGRYDRAVAAYTFATGNGF